MLNLRRVILVLVVCAAANAVRSGLCVASGFFVGRQCDLCCQQCVRRALRRSGGNAVAGVRTRSKRVFAITQKQQTVLEYTHANNMVAQSKRNAPAERQRSTPPGFHHGRLLRRCRRVHPAVSRQRKPSLSLPFHFRQQLGAFAIGNTRLRVYANTHTHQAPTRTFA